eukprot:COSAG04_NODE_1724_length_5798_cov_19.377610_7_plen_129_part_00
MSLAWMFSPATRRRVSELQDQDRSVVVDARAALAAFGVGGSEADQSASTAAGRSRSRSHSRSPSPKPQPRIGHDTTGVGALSFGRRVGSRLVSLTLAATLAYMSVRRPQLAAAGRSAGNEYVLQQVRF